MFYFHPTPLSNYSEHAHYAKAFTPEECEKIKAMWSGGGIARTQETGLSLLTHLPSEVRKAKVSWLSFNQETEWLFRKLHAYVHDVNFHRYHFDLSGFLEQLQLTRYDEGDQYKWHQDNGTDVLSVRKLSLVLQLSAPEDYEGGTLEFLSGPNMACNQGDLILFPSFNAHQVQPITKGTRYSLVAWVSGPPYR